MKDVETLTAEDIAKILPHLSTIKNWCDAVAAKAEALALAGTPIDGYKLVTGRTYRKLSDDEAAIHAMALYTNEPVMSRKPISPSKAIAMLGEKCDDVNALIVKPEGKPTLVPESDKRPAVPVADAFTVID